MALGASIGTLELHVTNCIKGHGRLRLAELGTQYSPFEEIYCLELNILEY